MDEGFEENGIGSKDREIVLPHSVPVYSELMSEGIEDAIGQEKIDTVLVEKTDVIEDLACLVDLSREDGILNCILEAISGMITSVPDEDSNMAIYIGTKDWASRVGYSSEYAMYDMIEPFLRHIFGERCKIYKKRKGESFREVKPFDVRYVVLNM